MRAMVLAHPGEPLRFADIPSVEPHASQILIKVAACGVCRTDLHVVDGELRHPKPMLVPGHEIVGHVIKVGGKTDRFKVGDRVGIPWLGSSCGHCRFCNEGRENLCPGARFTGYDIDGGYAHFAVADQNFCFPIYGDYSDAEAAPLLCAGLIGYRSLRLAGDGKRLGLYGFGAAAHMLFRLRISRGAKFSSSRAPAIPPPSNLPTRWERTGPGRPMRRVRRNWTPRSSLRRLDPWSLQRCARSDRQERSSAQAFI